LDLLTKTIEELSVRLGKPEGEPTPLDGGITNRNFRARFGGTDVVIRLPGKDTEKLAIDRGAERLASEAAARVGVGPEVEAMLEDPPCLVTRFIVGDQMTAADLREPAVLGEVAAALRAVHGAGELPVAFNSFRIVADYAAKATERGATLTDDYEWGRAAAARVEAALSGPEHDPVLCHDDLLAANFLRSADGIRIVDWEYAGMGDSYFDLGNFAVNNELGAEEEAALLEAYFGEEATPDRLAALRLMRVMSDFREAMWGVLQGTLSDLDFDFANYAAEHFGRMRKTAEDPGFEIWLEEAGGAAG
jgi:thiamine kinase-like enzyme